MHEAAVNGFFDELVKIAKRKKDDPGRITAEDAALGAGAAIGVHNVSKGLTGAAAHALMRGERGMHTSAEDITRLKKTISPNTPVFHTSRATTNSAFVPPMKHPLFRAAGKEQMRRGFGISSQMADHIMNLPGGAALTSEKFGPHVAAHELGHAAFHGTPLGRAVHHTMNPARLGKPVSVGMAAFADPDSTTSKAAPLVGALSAAPIMVNEGAASLRALRGMRAAGFSPQQLAQGRTQLLKAYGSYAAGRLLPAVGMPLAVRQVRKWGKRRRQRALER